MKERISGGVTDPPPPLTYHLTIGRKSSGADC
jgi:hypothetical protein